jgi:hypothetical protein
MQCKGRYCKEAREIKFPLISGYFTEQRCKNKASENPIDKELCDKCTEQKKAGFRCKNQQSYYQGKIDEPYFENSWLFGSPRYLKYIAFPGNTPPAEALNAAEEAQRTAREGGQMKDGAIAEGQKKPGRPPGSKSATNKLIQSTPKKTVHTVKSVAVESTEEPIEALEVVKVSLKPFVFKGTKYWHDEDNNLFYDASEEKIGTLIGRWNPSEEKLVRIFRSLEK